LTGKTDAVGIVADKTIPHADGILAESGVGSFHLALEKILADHAGTTNPLGAPQVKNIHNAAFCS
jgi:hypothetical protein